MGMRLRAQKPPLAGIYLPVEYVSGGAPDTIRKAYRQRSRWSKVSLAAIAPGSQAVRRIS